MSFDPKTLVDDDSRPDNFTATITQVRMVPRTYSRSSVKHGLFGKVTFKLDEGNEFDREEWTEYYPAGFLNRYVPSNDGVNPAGATMEEYQALANGEAAIGDDEKDNYEGTTVVGFNLSKNTDFSQFLVAMGDCGFKNWDEHATCLEGARATFLRLPQVNKRKPRPAKPGEPKQEEREFKVLVPVELHEAVATKAATKKTTPKANGAVNGSVDHDFDTRLTVAVAEALEAAGGTATKGKLVNKVMAAFSDPAEKAKALSRYQDVAYLGDTNTRPWTFDAASNTLTA